MQYDKNTFKVGNNVIVLNNNTLIRSRKWETYIGEVVRIGRTYMYIRLEGGYEIKIEIATGRGENDRYCVFPNRNAYADFYNTYTLRQQIKKAFTSKYKDLTVEQLYAMAELLGMQYERVDV